MKDIVETLIDDMQVRIEESRKKLECQIMVLDELKSLVNHQPANSKQSETSNSTSVDLSSLDLPREEDKRILIDDVRDIVNLFGSQEFRVAHVEKLLSDKGQLPKGKTPRARISQALKNLTEEDVILRTYKGRGKDPHRYKLIDSKDIKNEVPPPIER